MGASPLPSPEQRTRALLQAPSSPTTSCPPSRPVSPMPGARLQSNNGYSSASPHQLTGPPLHVPHSGCPGPANDPGFLRQSFAPKMEHAASMPNLASSLGFGSMLGSRGGLPPAPIPMKSQNLWEVEDSTLALWPNPSSAPPPPPPPPQPMPWAPIAPLSPPLSASGVIAQDHALIGPFQPWAPLRGGGPGGWPGPCGNMTPPPGPGWSQSQGLASSSSTGGLVHYDPGASSQSSLSSGVHERSGGQRSRKLGEESRSQTPSKSREPSWAPVVETPWAPVVRVGESMVCSSTAGGIERSELGGSLPSTNPNLKALQSRNSNLQESSSHALDVDFTSQCSPELLMLQKPQRGSETLSPRGGFMYPQSAAQSFDDPDPTWLRPPFGAQHQVSG